MNIIDNLNNLDNKSFIITGLSLLKEKNIITNEILEFLINKEFCNDNFQMHFSILREINEGMSKEETKLMYSDSKGYGRYYKRNVFFICNGRKFIICNDWYPIQREKLTRWIKSRIG